MRDDFRWFRPFRHLIYILLWIQTKILIHILSRFPRRNRQQSKDAKVSCVMLVYRDFGNTNCVPIENLIRNLREILGSTSVHVRVRCGNTLFGNVRWLKRQYRDVRPSSTIVCDPQLLGLPGVIGLFSLSRLVRGIDSDGAALSLFLFDLPDPQGALFGAYLLYRDCGVGLMCSTPAEGLDVMRRDGSTGPWLMATSSRDSSSDVSPASKRRFQVYLPRPSYEPRASFVERMSIELLERGIDFWEGGHLPNYEDLQSKLGDTRIAIVTNSIITGATGRWPRPCSLRYHLTYGNIEALTEGCVLLTEDCPSVRSVLVPGVHCLIYQSVYDAISMIEWILEHPSEADAIAECGKMYVNQHHSQLTTVLGFTGSQRSNG